MSEQDQPVNSGELARKFHETYERLAPQFGYETRPETKAWKPASANGQLMIAVCEELLAQLRQPEIAVCTKCDSLELVGSDDCRTCGINFSEENRRPIVAHEIVERQLCQPVSGTEVAVRQFEHDSKRPQRFLTLCCSYSFDVKDCPVYWNEFNRVVQCHACGHCYEPRSPQPVSAEADEIVREAADKLPWGHKQYPQTVFNIIRAAIARATAAKDEEIERINGFRETLRAKLRTAEERACNWQELAHDNHVRLTAAEEQLVAFGKVAINVVPGEHGQGEEVPATPESLKSHITYLQDEWDGAERQLAALRKSVEAKDEALRHAIKLLRLHVNLTVQDERDFTAALATKEQA